MNDQTENFEIALQPIFVSDEPDRRRSNHRVATGLLLAGLTIGVVAAPCTLWRQAWERSHFVTTKGHYIQRNHMSFTSYYFWIDHHGVKHIRELPLFSSAGKDFEVEYRRDRPSDGWIKSRFPSQTMMLLWMLNFTAVILLAIGGCLYRRRRDGQASGRL